MAGQDAEAEVQERAWGPGEGSREDTSSRGAGGQPGAGGGGLWVSSHSAPQRASGRRAVGGSLGCNFTRVPER